MEFTNRFRDIVLTPDAVGKIDELLTKFPLGNQPGHDKWKPDIKLNFKLTNSHK